MSVAVRARVVDSDVDRVVQAWKRSGHLPGTVVVVDSEEVPASTIDAVARVGVTMEQFADEWMALARVTNRHSQAIILSTRALTNPSHFVAAIREHVVTPVLLALRSGDLESARGAILAGAAPVLELPLRSDQVLQALLNIWQEPDPMPEIEVGALHLDLSSAEAHLDQDGYTISLELSLGECGLLRLLALREGQVVRREELLELWPSARDRNEVLNATVARLRRKLRLAGPAVAIHTVRGLGYRLDASRDAVMGA